MQDKRSPIAWLSDVWRTERPAAPLWAPVLLGLGVQIYFWAPTEPQGWVYSFVLAAPLLLWTAFWRRLQPFWMLGAAIGLVVIGFALAGARAKLVEAPVLGAPIDATVEGVVRQIGRSASGRPRLLLDRVLIFGVAPDRTPRRAQISLLREEDLERVAIGERVSIFARLGPPGAPVEPGGFDYRRTAWFAGLGAVGFANGPPVAIDDPDGRSLFRRLALGLAEIRGEIAAGLRARLPGETGAFAAAVTVGERAGVDPASIAALRDSNLAHLLAISGLHMGIMTGLVFGAARLLLAAIPYTARRWRTKKVAAIVALAGACFYLFLSGASVATQRAFVMAAVALVAVIANRPAITLRALAFAALIILTFRPESLTHVGFQMSFAATAAIVAGLEFGRRIGWADRFRGGGRGAQIAGYVAGLAATSLLAGLATAPIAAFHFNRVPHYGLIANLAAVPAMGFWVAPSALAAAVFAPFGLEGPALAAMGRGIEAILAVARFVADLPGATSPAPAGAPAVLALIGLGGLALCLGRGPLRGAGIVAVAAAFGLWAFASPRPALLAAPDAALLGVMTADGRSLDRHRGAGYAARIWLQRDGDDADQKIAGRREGVTRGPRRGEAHLPNGWRVVAMRDRDAEDADLNALCALRTILLAPHIRGDGPGGPCVFLGGARLKALGALSFAPAGDGVRILSAAEAAGDRRWTRATAILAPVIAGAAD